MPLCAHIIYPFELRPIRSISNNRASKLLLFIIAWAKLLELRLLLALEVLLLLVWALGLWPSV